MKASYVVAFLGMISLLALPLIGTAEDQDTAEKKCCGKAGQCCKDSAGEKSEPAAKECCSKGGKEGKCCKDSACTKDETAVKECCGKDDKCCKDEKCTDAVCLKGITCPISGGAADESVTVDHNGGKLYFCCNGCIDAFTKDMKKDGKKKFLAQANYQLVATGQAKQKGCPMSGHKCKDGTQIKVGPNNVEVGFCGPGCMEKAKSAKSKKQLAMLFSEKSFAKAFIVGEEKEEKKDK